MSDPLRPRRVWYVVAVLVLLAGLLGGAGAFIGIFTNLRDAAPSTAFAAGETARVRLDPADRPGIYQDRPPFDGTECQVTTSSDEDVPVSQPSGEQRVNGWELIFAIRPPARGMYEITCSSGEADGSGEAARFGVGKDMSIGRFLGLMFLGFGLPGLGLLAGTVIALVTALRRSSHKSRLLRHPR